MGKPEQRHLFPQTPDQLGPAVWERAAERDQSVAGIVFNRPLQTVFHYLVPDELRSMLAVGQRVKAPFGKGNRLTVGYCVGIEPSFDTSRRLKRLDSIIDREPLLSADMLELTEWIANRYLCGWGQVLESVVPAGVKKKAGTRSINVFRATPHAIPETGLREAGSALPTKQQAVWNLLTQSDKPLTAMEITDTVGCGTAPIEGLRKKGLIQVSRQRRNHFLPTETAVTAETDISLNRDQQAALDGIVGVLESRRHRTILLHGVTGSGKTEVYIRAIREVVGYRRQAIVLVPEISLTPQTIRRFRSRFDSVAVLHSHLSDAERHWQWQRIIDGEVQVVVGARSALFAPLPHLGLIVIDEEHETSFKQDSTPRYHARAVARKRAEMLKIPLILGTATPTLESWLRASRGDDLLLSMPRRVAGLPLPPVIVVDIRNDAYFSSGGAIGRALATAMQNALEHDGQIILFLNVRGFSPVLWCRACGNPVKCPHCDITLTWHKDRNVALCHSCEYNSANVTKCSECGRPGITLLGIGTQRLEAEVRARFGKYRCLRMDSDSMRKPGSHEEALQAFGQGDVRILLGTQMIAKGLDFPNVTLVGVINADTVLHQPDLRAAERTFQLISQVAGRTGRGRQGGRVFVQTCSPNEPAIRHAAEHNYLGFADYELVHRRELNAPPFTSQVRVIFRGPVEETVRDFARLVAGLLKESVRATDSPVAILGPAPAPVTRLRSQYRYHLKMSSVALEPVLSLWRGVVNSIPATTGVEYVVDVDPVNMR